MTPMVVMVQTNLLEMFLKIKVQLFGKGEEQRDHIKINSRYNGRSFIKENWSIQYCIR